MISLRPSPSITSPGGPFPELILHLFLKQDNILNLDRITMQRTEGATPQTYFIKILQSPNFPPTLFEE